MGEQQQCRKIEISTANELKMKDALSIAMHRRHFGKPLKWKPAEMEQCHCSRHFESKCNSIIDGGSSAQMNTIHAENGAAAYKKIQFDRIEWKYLRRNNRMQTKNMTFNKNDLHIFGPTCGGPSVWSQKSCIF